jgi:hypothetical protein
MTLKVHDSLSEKGTIVAIKTRIQTISEIYGKITKYVQQTDLMT